MTFLEKRGTNKASMYIDSAAAKTLQSCPTLCDSTDGSPPGCPVSGILQARTLEWVAISFSNAWKWKVKVKSLSCVWLLVTPWLAAYQAPPSMGFSRQEYWSGLPLPSLTLILISTKVYNIWKYRRKNWIRKKYDRYVYLLLYAHIKYFLCIPTHTFSLCTQIQHITLWL